MQCYNPLQKAVYCYKNERKTVVLGGTRHKSEFVCVGDGVFSGCFFAVQFASGVNGFDDGKRMVGCANEELLTIRSADDESKSARGEGGNGGERELHLLAVVVVVELRFRFAYGFANGRHKEDVGKHSDGEVCQGS